MKLADQIGLRSCILQGLAGRHVSWYFLVRNITPGKNMLFNRTDWIADYS